MDASQDRASGIPRLSRLPRPASSIPKPTPVSNASTSIRPKASRDSLNAPGADSRALQNPKLRASSSRGQLRPSDGRTTPLRTSVSRDQLRPSVARASSVSLKTQPAAATSTTRAVSTSQRRASGIAEKPWAQNSARRVSLRPGEFGRQQTERTSTPSGDAPESIRSTTSNQPPKNGHGLHSGDSLNSGHNPNDTVKPQPKKSRPSLSDRTMDTLSQIPSSPALKKKSSAFFDQARPGSRGGNGNSRPGSSHYSDGSGKQSSGPASRRGSSVGVEEMVNPSVRSSSNMFKRPLSIIHGTPEQEMPDMSITKSLKTPGRNSLSTASGLASPSLPSLPNSRSPSPEKRPLGRMPIKPSSSTISARSVKQRGPVNGLLKKHSIQALAGSAGQLEPPSPTTVWDGSIRPLSPPQIPDSEEAPVSSARKSSTALRDQIAKAKAAKRAAMRQASESKLQSPDSEVPIVPSDDGFDFGVAQDNPFNMSRDGDASGKVLKQRVGVARTSGRLNIAALGLKEIPSEVMKMYDFESLGAYDGSWAESVDLTRLIVADNALETLSDEVFPDYNPEDVNGDDEPKGGIFGALEVADLHGNLLTGLPVGFRRLSMLTTLNLSSNRLDNDSLEVLVQMTALRDLKLANNRLAGPLNASVSNLTALELLDIHGNKVTALPPNLENISRLRILNLSDNSIESLPFDSLSKLPLVELDAKRNKLSGTLIEAPIDSLSLLQTLDISTNQLTRIVPSGASISLPVVHTISLSMNRLQELPDMTTWTNLLTLTADSNKIPSLPASFTTLEKLRHADFTGNDIRVVPPEVARMDSLTLIRLTGNPLRDKKFASASTEEIKEVLAGRLEPSPSYSDSTGQSNTTGLNSQTSSMGMKHSHVSGVGGDDDGRSEDNFATPPTSAPNTPSRSRSHTLSNQVWLVKPGGLLDRSRTESSTLNPTICSELVLTSQVKQAQLHHNLFATFPSSLSFFAETLTSLALGHNQLVGETYLVEELRLPALRELNLASNQITSLGPLTRFLHAPCLEKIDISLNRLSAIAPGLKQAFPTMSVLLAPNNHLMELDPASVKGLKIVDVSSNNIAQLDPRIGLLGGQNGLERLEVSGNRFKVPRWNILEQGTAATLRWLRGRVPEADMAIWRKENGEDESDDLD